MVAGRAGGDQIGPGMLTAEVFGLDVIDGEKEGVFSTVLAGKLVAPEYFTTAQTHFWMGSVHHTLQTNDRGNGEYGVGGFDGAAAVQDEGGFFRQHETQSALKTAHIDGFKIRIQHKDRLIHI